MRWKQVQRVMVDRVDMMTYYGEEFIDTLVENVNITKYIRVSVTLHSQLIT